MSVSDVDGHKLHLHPVEVSDWVYDGYHYPLHIEAGITNKCNHRCIQCTLDWINHKNDFIDKDVFLQMINCAEVMGVKSIYFAGEGEPTMHPALVDFVKMAHDYGISTAISTNGALLTEELSRALIPYLSWIRFSVDAATPKTYAHIHGVGEQEWQRVWDNIQAFINLKSVINSNVQVGIQTLLMPENITEIEYLARISKEIGADNFQVKPAHCHPSSSYKGGLYKYAQSELAEQIGKLKDETFTPVVRLQSMERLTMDRNYKRCHAFDFYCLVDALGNVTPCNIWYGNPEYIFGNINNDPLIDIWNSKRRTEIINKITAMNHKECKEYRCRQDVMNRYLERVINPEINDEFI